MFLQEHIAVGLGIGLSYNRELVSNTQVSLTRKFASEHNAIAIALASR